jgi:hypothetical protein
VVTAKWKEVIEKDVIEGKRSKPTNERQESRLKVLDWKSKDCLRAQVNPENNNWEVSHRTVRVFCVWVCLGRRVLTAYPQSHQICKDAPKSLKQSTSIAPGGKRTGQNRGRLPGANGGVDECVDIITACSVVGGMTVKTFGIPVGNDYLTPKFVDGYLWVTTINTTPASDADTKALGSASVTNGDVVDAADAADAADMAD